MQHKSSKAKTNGVENLERRNSKPVAKPIISSAKLQLPLVVRLLWALFLAKEVFVKVVLCLFFFALLRMFLVEVFLVIPCLPKGLYLFQCVCQT